MKKHLMLIGYPGVGKTLLARGLARQDAPGKADSAVYRMAGLDCPSAAPFRAPHHTVSLKGLFGGFQPGSAYSARPGEVSLAHGGTLFLDLIEEFTKGFYSDLLHVMRRGEVVLQGAQGARLVLPAEFRLIVAANPTPCGYRVTDSRFRSDAEETAYHLERLAPFREFCEVLEEDAIKKAIEGLPHV